VIRHKGRIWLGHNSTLQLKIFSAFHSSSLGGHSGVPVTYKRIKQLFSWSGMKKMIKEWVQSCSICQHAKPERVKYPGILQPLTVPHRPWQHIELDIVEGLPQSSSRNCLLVVVDHFSCYSHFIPMVIPIQRLKWLSFLLTTFTSCTVFRSPSI
jgi:hypothetical protein